MVANYGYNPYLQQIQQMQTQQRISPLKIFQVSNILEANSTPVDNFEPVFFYNKAENVIYKKQIDNTGAAPIQVYKLEQVQQTVNEDEKNSTDIYIKNFETIENRLNNLSEKIDKLFKLSNEDIETKPSKKAKE